MKQLELPFGREFKIGDKVKILSKSVGVPLESSNIYNNGLDQGYWFVNLANNQLVQIGCLVVHYNKNATIGDFFLPEDLEKIE